MNRFQLFKTLRQHRKLAEKRAINFQENKTAKWVVWFTSALIFIYLIGFAIMFSLIINSSRTTTPLEFIFSIMPFMLLIDFGVRFLAQQTPSQLIRQYILLPISKYACIDTFIGTSLISWGNTIWFAMLLPYALMSVVFRNGIWITLGFLLIFYLLFMANSQWYAIVRTLINRKLLYWVIPLSFYALVFSPVILNMGSEKGWRTFFNWFETMGAGVEKGALWPYLIAALLLAITVAVNRKVQYQSIRQELIKEESQKLHHVTQFSALEKYGEIGLFLQLEIKTILRNKNPRKSFIFSSVIITLLSLIIAYTDVYDGRYMSNFWCIYNFAIYGAMSLIRIMSNEGNYIDGLLVHKENILKLLKAKYIFYSVILILPFVLMLPPVIAGKWSILMLIAYCILTIGFQYFAMFQLAVFNKVTMPLNSKFISKSGIENNYVQIVIQMIVFFVPLLLVSILQVLFSDTIAYLITLFIGLAFIFASPLWLKNIYQRMMKRKYILLEGFRSTR